MTPGPSEQRLVRLRRAVVGIAVLAVLASGAIGSTSAAFVGATTNGPNVLTAKTDWLAPTVSRMAAIRPGGTQPGHLSPTATGAPGSGQYQLLVFAEDAAATPPATSTANLTVTGDARTLTTADTAVALTKLNPVVTYDGVTYNYRSAARPVSNTFAAGINNLYNLFATATDASANSATLTPAAQTYVDNIRTNPQDLSIVNGTRAGSPAGVLGTPNLGDDVTVGWVDAIEPSSVVTGWDGSGTTPVTVRVANGAANGPDTMTIWNDGNTAQLPLGSITIPNGYFTAATTFGAPGAAARSLMTWQDDTVGFAGFQIDLGTVQGTVANVAGNTALVWASTATVYDRGGNYANANAAFAEPAPADRDF